MESFEKVPYGSFSSFGQILHSVKEIIVWNTHGIEAKAII